MFSYYYYFQTKVKSIEGVLYKTSANKLEKQDQAAGPLPKKCNS